MADIEIRGLDRLQRKLKNLQQIETKLKPWAEDTLKEAQKHTDYTQTTPPRRPGQRYIRTFKLMGEWRNQVRISGKTITARRYNNRTPYGLWVMGRRTQTGIFRGRWPTDEQIEKRIAGKAVKDLQKIVDEELAK